MSYCRFGEGDVYMYGMSDGICCCACLLSPTKGLFGLGFDMSFDGADEALDHLFEHRKAGHDVPEYAIARLTREVEDAE